MYPREAIYQEVYPREATYPGIHTREATYPGIHTREAYIPGGVPWWVSLGYTRRCTMVGVPRVYLRV